jgi:hypothetical protein
VQYDSTKSCLDEIKRILEQVKAKFLADWNAEKKASKDPGKKKEEEEGEREREGREIVLHFR